MNQPSNKITLSTEFRGKLINQLIGDPRFFVNNLYITERRWFGLAQPKLAGSTGFSIDDPNLCCLLGKLGFQPAQLPEFCLMVTDVPLENLGDLATPSSDFTQIISRQDNSISVGLLKSKYLSDGTSISLSDTPPSSLKAFMGNERLLRQCGFPDLRDNLFIASDIFTNDVIIGFLLSTLQIEQKGKFPYPGVLEYKTATICRSDPSGSKLYGAILMETSTSTLSDFLIFQGGESESNFITVPVLDPTPRKERIRQVAQDQQMTLEEQEQFYGLNIMQGAGAYYSRNILKPELIFGLLGQAICLLHFMDINFAFHFGISTTDSWFITPQPVNFTYTGLSISCPISIKMANFSLSSISIYSTPARRALRLYPASTWAARYLNVAPFTPNVEGSRNGLFFQIDNLLNAQVYAKMYYAGVPYYTQIDTYIFLISFFCFAETYYAAILDKRIARVWEKAWTRSDLKKINRRVKIFIDAGRQPTFDEIITMIKGIQLNCQIGEILIKEMIKQQSEKAEVYPILDKGIIMTPPAGAPGKLGGPGRRGLF